MSGGAIVFCILVVVFFALVALMLWLSEVAERSDTYKGVRNFSSIVHGEMEMRCLHNRRLTGHAVFCSSCRKRDQCYKECEERMKRVIDAEQEVGAK